MHRRYLRIDIEYDMDADTGRLYSYIIIENIKHLLTKDSLASCKIVFTRDSPTDLGLDESRYRG